MKLEQLQEEQNFLIKDNTEICNLVEFSVIQASLLLPSFLYEIGVPKEQSTVFK